MRKGNLDRKKNVRFTEKNNVTVQNQPPNKISKTGIKQIFAIRFCYLLITE